MKLHWLSHLVCVLLIPETHTILSNLKINEGWKNILSDTEFLITCSFIIYFKIINACSKVVLECIICFVSKMLCRAPPHEECLKYYGHKGDLGVTPGTCDVVGERAPSIGNASHLHRLGVTMVRPSAVSSLWRADSRMLKNTSIGGVR